MPLNFAVLLLHYLNTLTPSSSFSNLIGSHFQTHKSKSIIYREFQYRTWVLNHYYIPDSVQFTIFTLTPLWFRIFLIFELLCTSIILGYSKLDHLQFSLFTWIISQIFFTTSDVLISIKSLVVVCSCKKPGAVADGEATPCLFRVTLIAHFRYNLEITFLGYHW